MTAHEYSTSPPSHIAGGLAAVSAPDVRKKSAVMGGQKPVDLY